MVRGKMTTGGKTHRNATGARNWASRTAPLSAAHVAEEACVPCTTPCDWTTPLWSRDQWEAEVYTR